MEGKKHFMTNDLLYIEWRDVWRVVENEFFIVLFYCNLFARLVSSWSHHAHFQTNSHDEMMGKIRKHSF